MPHARGFDNRRKAARFRAKRYRREEWLENCRRDLHQALRLRHDDDWLALNRQGVYLRYIGDYQGSAEAFGQAVAVSRISSGSVNPVLVHHHCLALHALGRLEEALDQLEPTCAAHANFYALHTHRAILLAELGRLDAGRAACRICLNRQQGNANGLLWSMAVAELLGDSAAAAAALRTFANRDPTEITSEDAEHAVPSRSLRYFLGELDDTALLADADADPGSKCEFAFLVGLCKLGRGDREGGLASLRMCLETGVFFYGDHRFSQALLARAAADPNWPAWTNKAP